MHSKQIKTSWALGISSLFLLNACMEQPFSITSTSSTTRTADSARSGGDNTISGRLPDPLGGITVAPSPSPIPATPTPVPPGTPTPTPATACNPLGGGTAGASLNNGVKAQMYYLEDAQLAAHNPAKVADLYDYGKLSSVDFYFNDFNVPTRNFSSGFSLKDGSKVSKSDGTALFEYFGFRFKTEVKLPKGSAAKKMQFALMSDDGANLLIQDPVTKAWSTAVSNDGQHASQFACGSRAVQLSADTSVPIEVQYYQGPRYEIANVLLWREWKDSNSNEDCGKGGGFFDTSTTPSTPNQAWKDILTRWQVVPADVLFIQSGEVNPCK